MNETTTFSIWVLLKNASYAASFAASSAFLGITPISVEVLGMLIFADVCTGVLKSAVCTGPRSIKSSIFERGLIAKALLMIVPITLALAGKGVGIQLDFVAQGTLNMLILSEAYSIIGNIYSIRTGVVQQEFDAVAFVLGSIKNVLKKFIVEDSPAS